MFIVFVHTRMTDHLTHLLECDTVPEFLLILITHRNKELEPFQHSSKSLNPLVVRTTKGLSDLN